MLFGSVHLIWIRMDGIIMVACGTGLPTVLDGVPSRMRPFVDVFLWSSLAEACVKARVDHNINRDCQTYKLATINLCILVIIVFSGIWISQQFGPLYPKLLTRLLIATIPLIGVVLSWGITSISNANAAKRSFHPRMRKITAEFAFKFQQAGYRMEYVTEDGVLLSSRNKRAMLPMIFKSGKSFFRFEPCRHDTVNQNKTVTMRRTN